MIPDRPSQPNHAANAKAAQPGRKAVPSMEIFPKEVLAPDMRETWKVRDGKGREHQEFSIDPASVQEATHWHPGDSRMSGAQANEAVTDFYDDVDSMMESYLGQPAIANWATFAKYASREAGEQIRQMEGFLKVTHGHSPQSLLALFDEFLAKPGALWGELKVMRGQSKSPAAFVEKVQRLRNALVAGNTGIIGDIVPGFSTFLHAEFRGRDGVKALEAQGFGKAPRDPDGLILDAFRHFQAARRLGDQASKLPMNSPEAKRLLDERAHQVAAANLRLGIQEQWATLQQPHTFGDPVVARIVQALTPSMSLTDATGTHDLLPNGGNWANFADRMGLIEVDPAQLPEDKRRKAYILADAQGQKHHYVLNPDRKAREGSIFQYFTANRGLESANALEVGHVRPYTKTYDHFDAGFKAMWEGLKGHIKRRS